MVASTTRPLCPSCGRMFIPGVFWSGANYCRALYLMSALPEHEGSSAAELAEATGMTFGDAAKGMTRLRERDAVRFEAEERGQGGGFRYRFYSRDDHEAQLTSLTTFVQQLESRV